MNDFIKKQQEFGREVMSANMIAFEEMTRPSEKDEKRPEAIYANLDNIITQIITNTGNELMRRADGEYQVWVPDDKAFMEHGTTERLNNDYNQAIDTMKQNITDVTGVE